MTGTPDAISTVDARSFDGARRRTLALRAALGLVIVALLAVGVYDALGLQAPSEDVLPQGKSGVVVLDLSRSIGIGPARAVRKALARVDSPSQRLGLVVFSDTAYELFPPGSPGTELRSILRFFVPAHGGKPSDRAGLPVSPWDESFRAGTQISGGLWEGMQALNRAHVRNGTVLLISDLADEPDDMQKLVPLVIQMQRAHVKLKILPLDPAPNDRNLFQRLAGKDAFVDQPPSLGIGGVLHRIGERLSRPLPWGLVMCALALLAALGLNELFCGRLELPVDGRTA